MSGELRILLLEDRPADAELVRRELRKEGIPFAVNCVATEAAFLSQLRDNPPDLILADYSLPAYDGLSALASAQEECPQIPFIFVSGSLREETAIGALHEGATDYVLKERLSRLGPTLQQALREVEQAASARGTKGRFASSNCSCAPSGASTSSSSASGTPAGFSPRPATSWSKLAATRLAWAGLAEPGSKRVAPAARAGDRADYLDEVRMTWDETPTGQGPTGTAMRTGRPWVCQDTATDERFTPWRKAALARGYASAAAAPLIQDTQIVGAVTVYSHRRSAFHEEEIDLLKMRSRLLGPSSAWESRPGGSSGPSSNSTWQRLC